MAKIASQIAAQVRQPPSYIDAKVLAAGVAETFTVPAGQGCAFFGYSATGVYVRVNATATVPIDTSDGTASAHCPTAYQVKPADTISVIAEAACKVTIEYYITVPAGVTI